MLRLEHRLVRIEDVDVAKGREKLAWDGVLKDNGEDEMNGHSDKRGSAAKIRREKEPYYQDEN